MDGTVFMHKLTEKSVQSKRQAAPDGLPTVKAGITHESSCVDQEVKANNVNLHK